MSAPVRRLRWQEDVRGHSLDSENAGWLKQAAQFAKAWARAAYVESDAAKSGLNPVTSELLFEEVEFQRNGCFSSPVPQDRGRYVGWQTSLRCSPPGGTAASALATLQETTQPRLFQSNIHEWAWQLLCMEKPPHGGGVEIAQVTYLAWTGAPKDIAQEGVNVLGSVKAGSDCIGAICGLA